MKQKEDMFYVNLRQGLNSKPLLVQANENIEKLVKNPNKDWYISLFKYNEGHKKHLEEKGSLSGIRDTITDRLYFDFDNKHDLDLARKDAVEAATRLIDSGISEEAIGCFFTGSKGFNLEVKINEKITPEQFKAIVFKIAGDLSTFDKVVNDPNRIVRIPNTKHQETGLYKIELEPHELVELNIEEIKEKAKTRRVINRVLSSSDLPNELKEIEVEKAVDKIQKELTFDISSVDLKQRPKGFDEPRWLLANGFFRHGERNHSMLCLAATYKNLHYPQELTQNLLKGVAEIQAKRTGEDVFADKEIDLIVDQVYGPNWKGGQFTTRDPSNWLAQYARKMGLNIKEDEDTPKTIEAIAPGFIKFIKEIEKNTVKTGIETLDKIIPMTVGSNIGIVAGPGVGKCLGKDTPIMMFDGSIKLVQDVVEGDLLMGDDSTPRKVLGTTRGREKLYKVKQSYGDSYVVNASHIISLKTNENRGGFQKNEVIDINIEEYISKCDTFKRRFKGYKVPVDFGNSEVLVDPYFLGVWLGDGDKNNLRVTNVEPEIKEYLKKYADKLGMNYKEDKYGTRTETLRLIKLVDGANNSSKSSLQILMEKYNLFGNKHIPKDYLKSNRETRLQLLAGLIDSDGYLDTKDNSPSFEIIQKNKNLADQIVFLIRSLGFKSTIHECQKSCNYKGEKREGTYYRIYIKTNDLSEIPTKVKRKQCNIQNNSINYLLSSLEFEDLGEGDYYGFEVDGNHRFLLGDFTVTHNTALALKILKYNSKKGIVSVFASLDMSRNRLFEKVVYNVTGMSRDDMYKAFREGKYQEIIDKVKEEYGNVWFYDKTAANMNDIKEFVKNVEQKTGEKVKLLMIDYFERVNSDVSDDTAASKKVANEIQDAIIDLDVLAITLYQPNKMSLGSGPDTEIKSYTAIKGSSFIYQAARGIIGLSRPFYTPKTKDLDKFMVMNILKNDLGELDRLELGWNGKTGEIFELEDHEKDELHGLMAIKDGEEDGGGEWS